MTDMNVPRPTSQSLSDVLHGGPRLVPQQRVERHHHPWRAEATLGAVKLGDPLLRTARRPALQRGPGAGTRVLLLALGGSWSWCCRRPPPWSRRLRGAGRWAGGRQRPTNVWHWVKVGAVAPRPSSQLKQELAFLRLSQSEAGAWKDTWWFWSLVDSATAWLCTHHSLRLRSRTWFLLAGLTRQWRKACRWR